MGHERMTHCFKAPALLANAWEQAGKLAGSNGLCRTIFSMLVHLPRSCCSSTSLISRLQETVEAEGSGVGPSPAAQRRRQAKSGGRVGGRVAAALVPLGKGCWRIDCALLLALSGTAWHRCSTHVWARAGQAATNSSARAAARIQERAMGARCRRAGLG